MSKFIKGPSEEHRERQIAGAWAKEVDEVDQLKALCRSLASALKDWQKFDTESSDKHPCPDAALRAAYRKRARAITDVALTEYKNLLGE